MEQEAERQRYLSQKEKNEIRKEVVLLQDTIKGRDRVIAELKETVQVYEEERNWIKRFFSGFYQLLNIRLMLRKMGFSDDRIAEMYRTETPLRGTAKAYSGLYKREVYGRGQRNPYHQGREETTSFDHQRASHYRLVRTEMETANQSQPLATTVIAFFFHRQEEKQRKDAHIPS